MKKSEQAVRPFGLRDKIGYLFGDFGNDFTFVLASSFMMKFYTDIMGISASVVGIVMMVARFVDAFTDVTMGRICDRSPVTEAGKFRPWIRRMCGPVAICSFLIYQSSLAGMSNAFKIGYLFVTYILWGSVFYTSINIPYGSMASAISPDAGDRQSLSTFRTMGGALANLIIGAGVPLLAYDTVNGNKVMNGSRFTMIAGVFSVLTVLCYLACYSLTTERVRPKVDPNRKQDDVLEMFKKSLTNRALISIIVSSIVMLLGQLTLQSMSNFVYPNYYGSTAAQSLSAVTLLAGMMLAGAVIKPIIVKIGKAELGVIANLVAAVICVVLFVWRPANVWVFVGMNFFVWLCVGMLTNMSWSMITDVIDYSELRNGVREDGSVYALYSFARKLGQAASAGLAGALLDMVGYSQATQFDASVTNGIYNISTLLPALGFVLMAAILWFWYPLHKKQVDENIAALKEKHNA